MQNVLHRTLRTVGAVSIVAGLLVVAWVLTVWRWQDPFTAIYTHHEQRALAKSLERQLAAYPRRPQRTNASAAVEERQVAAAASRYRNHAVPGQAIGRIIVPRMHLNMVVVNGTDDADLRKGPGRYLGSAMPGEGQLVYLAGHRTTYLAPFSAIDSLRRGDQVTLEMPYATFVYRVTGHRIVLPDDVAVLRSRGYEQLILQACQPRFFATHRYLAYASPIEVIPRSGRAYHLTQAELLRRKRA